MGFVQGMVGKKLSEGDLWVRCGQGCWKGIAGRIRCGGSFVGFCGKEGVEVMVLRGWYEGDYL